jgi:hypothetical protein
MDYEEAPSASQVLYGREPRLGGDRFQPAMFGMEDGGQFGIRGRQNRGPQQQDEKIVDTDFFNSGLSEPRAEPRREYFVYCERQSLPTSPIPSLIRVRRVLSSDLLDGSLGSAIASFRDTFNSATNLGRSLSLTDFEDDLDDSDMKL